MPLKTHVRWWSLRRNNRLLETQSAIHQKMRMLLTQRLADLDREAKRIAQDRQRVEEYLRTLPNP